MPANWRNTVRPPEKTREAILSKVVAGPANCWIWTGRVNGPKNYGAINFSGTKTSTHRAMYQIVNSIQLRRDQHIMHKCDVNRCCNPDHLSVGDNFLNQQDRVQKGRFTKLQPQDVFAIRGLHKQGFSYERLSIQFGILPNSVKRIVVVERWGHLRDKKDKTSMETGT